MKRVLSMPTTCPACAHALDVLVEPLPCRLGDHRADIDRQAVGIAKAKLSHGAFQHGHDTIGDIVLQAEHAQRRAARGAHRRLAGGGDGSIYLLDVVTMAATRSLNGHAGGVNDLVVTPGGRFVISASDDQTLRVWRASDATQLRLSGVCLT